MSFWLKNIEFLSLSLHAQSNSADNDGTNTNAEMETSGGNDDVKNT